MLVRTDFEDQTSWAHVRDAAMAVTLEGYMADLTVLEDRAFDGWDALANGGPPDDYEPRLVVVFDRICREHPDHPLLLVDYLAHFEAEGVHRADALRVVPGQVHTVEANLSLANMDFEDFTMRIDADGIIRSC